ncbi:MAG: Ppx/GppA phosphatase family protein [Acidimicrobiia bacterium]|nr:Ppx/GppA phosphatase family protein [Acidimicrobiia bacterium]
MKVASVDIGTNSMRLLIVQLVGDGLVELGRWQRVTGLGRGVDAKGFLSEEAMDRTLLALAEFGGRMANLEVDRRRAVATSASRDASNREMFFDRAEIALGVRPELISGEEEARLAFAGATSGMSGPGPFVVVDIGGGSTEFVTADGGRSFDMGSVRLSDRVLPNRPAAAEEVAATREMVREVFSPVTPMAGTVIGVAGTWTSLAGIRLGRDEVHLTELTATDVSGLVDRLAILTVEQTAALPGLDPARAPVILAGAVVAESAMSALGAEKVVVSEHDLLDGVVAALVG